MEKKKYTTHSSFWWSTVLSILWAISMVLVYILSSAPHTLLIALYSLTSVSFLIVAIQCRLAWHAYVEISDEGVKMKGCAKRISDKKKETIDNIFIPWGDVEEIKGGIGGTALVLKTGEKIILTQQMDVDSSTFRSAFDRYIFKQQQEEFKQLKNDSDQLEITSVISAIDNDNKL